MFLQFAPAVNSNATTVNVFLQVIDATGTMIAETTLMSKIAVGYYELFLSMKICNLKIISFKIFSKDISIYILLFRNISWLHFKEI